MFRVTEKAVDLLDEMRADAIKQAGMPTESQPALRLVTRKGEIGLTVDTPGEGDQVVEREGHPVLLVDKKVSKELDGTTIDAEETAEGTRLVVE